MKVYTLTHSLTYSLIYLLTYSSGNIEIARYLLSNSINVNECNNYGDSAIGLACYGGHIPLIKLLLDHGADIYSRNAKGKNGVDYLNKEKKNEIISYMKSKYTNSSVPRAVEAVPVPTVEPKFFSLFNAPEAAGLKVEYSPTSVESSFHLPSLDWFLDTKETTGGATSNISATVPSATPSEVGVWLESLGLGEYSSLLRDAGAFTIPLKEFILIFESADLAGTCDDEIEGIIPNFKATFKPMHKKVFKRKIKELLSSYVSAGSVSE